MGRPRKKYKTFHISVADSDTDIMEWLAAQFNQSASVRQLIRMQIDNYGINDLFSGDTFRRAEGQSGRATGSTMDAENALKAARELSNTQDNNQYQNNIPPAFDDNNAQNTAKIPSSTVKSTNNSLSSNKSGDSGIIIDKDVLGDVIGAKKKNKTDDDITPTKNNKTAGNKDKMKALMDM